MKERIFGEPVNIYLILKIVLQFICLSRGLCKLDAHIEQSIDFNSSGIDEFDLDFDTEINLYRLIQKILSNIKKHADANQVWIGFVAS